MELRKKDTRVYNEKISYKYLSKDAQNEIIDTISSKIKKMIAKECSDKPFSIIIDETPDIANHE